MTTEAKKIPKLMFISEDGFKAELFIDGEKINGAKSISIRAYLNEPIEHEVNYLTACCGKDIDKE